MNRTAVVAGPTGLVGAQLLQRLLHDPAYREVRALTRRPLGVRHDRLRELHTDYAQLDLLGDALAVDDVFCCLGTTMAVAGSRAAFEDVDYRMVVDLARVARHAGAQQFLVVSAVGASRHALAFYSRVKGRMEAAVSQLDYAAVHILRPSLLLGERAQSRPAEDLAQRLAPAIAPLLRGPLRRYRPVRGADVAEAMLRLALRGEPGVHVHHLPLRDGG
ncbi:NAD-dependent epimerase/dehydratase family protein [Sinimarinibacterium thermocellulolyticum]|uniref:NAD-dependent epimerase/dehydratase family protein n=1 Tax=Sinimarinibacterium thermocellulolyticum TaxID=3170016 RepID=A0ABV2ADH2_9GAMM